MINLNVSSIEAMVDKMVSYRADLFSTRHDAERFLNDLLVTLDNTDSNWVASGGFRLVRDDDGAVLDFNLVSGFPEWEPYIWDANKDTKAKSRLLDKQAYSSYYVEAETQRDLFDEIGALAASDECLVQAVAPSFDSESGMYTALVTVSS